MDVEVTEHPRTPKYLIVRSHPREVLPDYNEKALFNLKRINEDFSSENFPEDQTFDVQMDESKQQYAVLHDPATDQKGTSLSGVTANFHMDIKSYEEIGNFTDNIEILFEVSTKVPDPISGELIEIDGNGGIDVVNKKMFLNFTPNPVAKGDTALVKRRIIYANGVQKQLPLDYDIPFASIELNSRSFGTLRSIGTGETGNYLYGVTEGLQFISRDDIDKDKVKVRMVASSYVDKEMPTSGGPVFSSQTLSENKSNFDNLSTEEKKIMDQRYWESVETGSIDTSGSDTPKLMESSDIGIMSHNSDQDYIYGYGNLIIGNELEPCEPYYPENQIFGKRVDDNDGCDSDDLGSTRIVPESIETNFSYCFSTVRNQWEGQLLEFKKQVNYGICVTSVENKNLVEINSAYDSDINKTNYCNINEKISKLLKSLKRNNKREYTDVWSSQAILEHEKVHVDQIKNEVYEELVLKRGGLINLLKTEEYSLVKNKASNTNEARQKLSSKTGRLKEIYLKNYADYLRRHEDRLQLEAEKAEEEVYAKLVEAVEKRAEAEKWKPCTE